MASWTQHTVIPSRWKSVPSATQAKRGKDGGALPYRIPLCFSLGLCVTTPAPRRLSGTPAADSLVCNIHREDYALTLTSTLPVINVGGPGSKANPTPCHPLPKEVYSSNSHLFFWWLSLYPTLLKIKTVSTTFIAIFPLHISKEISH